MLEISRSLYLCNHLLESIHSWTKGTLSSALPSPPHPTTPSLPYPTLPYPTLTYPILNLFYPTLPYPTPHHPTPPHPTPPHLTSPHPTPPEPKLALPLRHSHTMFDQDIIMKSHEKKCLIRI